MPEIYVNKKDLIIDAPDEVIEGTTIKRKVRVNRLVIDREAQSVVISYTIIPYAVGADGGYGPSLEGHPLSKTVVSQFVADNATIVDIQGGLLAKIIECHVGEDGKLLPNTRIQMWDSSDLLFLSEAEAAAQEEQTIPSEVEGEEPTVIPAKAAGPLHNVPFLREWNFYELVADSQNVTINPLIMQKMSDYLNRF